MYDVKASRSQNSRHSEVLKLYNSEMLFPILLLVPQFCLYICFNLQGDDAKFFEFSKSAEDGSSGAG